MCDDDPPPLLLCAGFAAFPIILMTAASLLNYSKEPINSDKKVISYLESQIPPRPKSTDSIKRRIAGVVADTESNEKGTNGMVEEAPKPKERKIVGKQIRVFQNGQKIVDVQLNTAFKRENRTNDRVAIFDENREIVIGRHDTYTIENVYD